MNKRCIFAVAALTLFSSAMTARAQAVDEARIQALEEQLGAARGDLESLRQTIDGLVVELESLRAQGPNLLEADDTQRGNARVGQSADALADASPEDDYRDRILVGDLGSDERGSPLTPRPELFVQNRFHADPIDEATDDDVTRNFGLNRAEMRWSGRLSDKIGMGLELQYHPALDDASEELINDAFVEYYPADSITIRAGQFVKPFGFDIQHSSGDRESPERGIFAGYFFPGQRDRGLMLAADLGNRGGWLEGTTVYAGVFNGNRFFDDNNRELNYNLRIRKVFDTLPLAVGASLQRGTQILPPGVSGNDDENAYGFDLQYVVGRLGMRLEYVHGNMPSTLLGLVPEFAPGFAPGEKSTGAAAFFNYNLTPRDDIYWRWDRFENDPVTRNDIRAFNVGYLRAIGTHSRIGIDYQIKNHVTFNDDDLNNAFSITWNVAY